MSCCSILGRNSALLIAATSSLFTRSSTGSGVPAGREYALPRRHDKSGHSRFFHVRKSGSDAMRLLPGHRERAEPPLFHVRHRRQHGAHEKLRSARDHVHERGRGALVRHVLRLEARALREENRREMRARAGARRGVVELSRPRFGVIDELRHRLRRQRRMHDENQAARAHLGHGRDVLERIVAELHVQSRRQRDRVRGIEQRVAVRVRLGQQLDRDVARGPRPVVDHDALIHLSAELFAHEASHDIGRPAGGKSDEHADRLGRPRLRKTSRAGDCQRHHHPDRNPLR